MKKFVHDANMWYNMSRFTKKERNMENFQYYTPTKDVCGRGTEEQSIASIQGV